MNHATSMSPRVWRFYALVTAACGVLVSLGSFMFPVPVQAATLTELTFKAALAVSKQKPAADKLTVQGQFRLAGGIADPATETVTLSLGPFLQELPLGSFTKAETRKKTTWSFKGAKGGLTNMTISRAGDQWQFSAAATGLTLLPPPTNPLTLSLQIGDDSGAETRFFAVTDTAKKTLLKFPPGKKDDADGDGVTPTQGDCDDQDPTIFPAAPELCNNTDDNCNGAVDEGFSLGISCTVGIGACAQSGITVCAADESRTVCNATPGTPTPEVCNGLDDDCNGQVDDGVLLTFFADQDMDGFGDPAVSAEACAAPPGYVTNNQDCNDRNPNIHPGAKDIPGNGIDEDCNGSDSPIAALTVLPSMLRVKDIGTTAQMHVFFDNNGVRTEVTSDSGITYVSSDPSVVAVDTQGLLTFFSTTLSESINLQ